MLFVNFRLRDSRIGRAWIAIREDEVAAVSMGIPTVRVKLLAYALGAAMGGMAGTFLGSFYNTVNADQFEFSFSIFVLAMIILGGLGSIWGVVVGALLLSYINTNLIPDVLNDVPSKIGLDFDVTELGFGIFGFLLVIMMVLRPQGLIPERSAPGGVRRGEPTRAATRGGDARMSTPEAQAEQDRLNAGPAVLETVYLTKIFGGLTAVDGVSFRVPEKSIVSIIGPNGAGKTTFFNMLTGLYKPSLGRRQLRRQEGDDASGRTRSPRWASRGRSRTSACSGRCRRSRTCSSASTRGMKASVFGSIFRAPVGAQARSARPARRRTSCSATSGSPSGATTTPRAT